MRLHRRIAVAHMGGQHDGDRRGVTVLLPAPLEGEAHGVGVRHIARQRIENGGLQIGGAEAFEQPQQGCGDGAEISAARGGTDE